MDSSGSGPQRRVEPRDRAQPKAIACHVCFFCGSTFTIHPDYQRHIVHEHQMASIAYQLYAEEHPPNRDAGGVKRTKSDDRKKKENGEKKPKMDPPTSSQPKMDPSTPSQSQHSPVPPSTSRPAKPPPPMPTQPSSFTAPSYPSKPLPSPLLPPGRYPANKQLQQQRQVTTPATPARKEPMAGGPSYDLCAVCGMHFAHATPLIVHAIKEHNAIIQHVDVVQEFPDKRVSNAEYKYSKECGICGVKTPTLTKCFEHSITLHKGVALSGSSASSIAYTAQCVVLPTVEFSVRIKLIRSRDKTQGHIPRS